VRFCAVVKASAERRQVLVGYLFEYFMPEPGKSLFREKTATKPAILKAFLVSKRTFKVLPFLNLQSGQKRARRLLSSFEEIKLIDWMV
jgi:hypothetical protein